MELATSNDINSKNNNTNNKQILESASAVPSASSPRSFADEAHPPENVIPSSVVVGLLLEQVGKL